jgi:hypothetical protein
MSEAPLELWRVQLPDHPLLEVFAADRRAAVEEYNRRCGITEVNPQLKHTAYRVGPDGSPVWE